MWRQIQSKLRVPNRIKVRLPSEEKRRLIACNDAAFKPPSAIFYTMHKCASTFQAEVLEEIAKHTAYRHMDYANYIWALGDRINVGSPYEPFLAMNGGVLFRKHGELYGPQRKYLSFPEQQKFKSIFFLRDPRDALVSSYYSFGFTHGIPRNEQAKEKFLANRKDIQGGDIDAYCLRDAEAWIRPLFEGYADLYERLEDKIFLSYDDYARDTRDFVRRLCEYLVISLPEYAVMALAHRAKPVRASAPVASHKRSGKSRQFVEELRPETVAQLNETLRPILDFWGFPV